MEATSTKKGGGGELGVPFVVNVLIKDKEEAIQTLTNTVEFQFLNPQFFNKKCNLIFVSYHANARVLLTNRITENKLPEFKVGNFTQVPNNLGCFPTNPSFTRLSNVAETQLGLW